MSTFLSTRKILHTSVIFIFHPSSSQRGGAEQHMTMKCGVTPFAWSDSEQRVEKIDSFFASSLARHDDAMRNLLINKTHDDENDDETMNIHAMPKVNF